jgi:phosphatidylinositol glycan class B
MFFTRFTHFQIFLLLIAWRVSSVFIVQTSHVPDEYWQSLEVAHKLAFNYGYLTWEWHIGIRNYLYPFLISIFYWLTNILQVDYDFILIFFPRIFQALLSAYSEYRFYIWTGSKFALFNLCINWYWYYCATRTIINSFETCLTIIALSIYPWKKNSANSKYLWIVSFLCFMRPTAAIIWLPLCLYHLVKNKHVFSKYLFIGLSCLILSILVDVLCYGKIILTPLEFFKLNVVKNISVHYGKMHLLWYFTSALPVILGLHYALLPLAIFKIYKNYIYLHKSLILTFVAIWSISIYSLIAHKEFRFILPLLPMFIYIINENVLSQKIVESKKKLWIFLLIISNIVPGFYFSVLHQRGALKVMEYLRNEIQTNNTSEVDILFLTVCHSTPYYSHLHKNVSMRSLTCEPNLKNIKNYYDESDEFFMNPMKWLEVNYLTKSVSNLPSYVIVYDTTVEFIEPFLKHYKKLISYQDSLFPLHGKFSAFIIYRYQLNN